MTPSPAAPGSSFFLSSLTFLRYLFFILTHSLSYSIYFSSYLPFCQCLFSHPLFPSSNIHFSFSLPFCQYQIFTLGLALPIINPHFCTCAVRSTATGTRRQDHGSWSTAALVLAGHGPQDHGSWFRPAGFRPAGPRPANLIL